MPPNFNLIETVFDQRLLFDIIRVKRRYCQFYREWYDLFCDLFEQKQFIIFDEFQNFDRINPAILSAFQHAWDDHHGNTKLFVLGSYAGMMKKIFTDVTVPLFGRNDYMIRIGSFSQFETLKILTNYG
jgi:AAA+ ATPase superfamily predicted ATPase